MARFMLQRLAAQQFFGFGCSQPTTFLSNADRYNFVFVLINRIENGCRGKKRDLVFTTAATEEDAHANFFHHFSLDARESGVNYRL